MQSNQIPVLTPIPWDVLVDLDTIRTIGNFSISRDYLEQCLKLALT